MSPKPSPHDLLRQMREQDETLSSRYPYSFRLGAFLRDARPGWHEEFIVSEPLASSAPLLQARDYAFLVYLEEVAATDLQLRRELDQLAEEFFIACPEPWRCELANTVRWFAKPEISLPLEPSAPR